MCAECNRLNLLTGEAGNISSVSTKMDNNEAEKKPSQAQESITESGRLENSRSQAQLSPSSFLSSSVYGGALLSFRKRIAGCCKLIRKSCNYRAKARCKTNAIHTSKYTVLSFLPKTLFYQFSRFGKI